MHLTSDVKPPWILRSFPDSGIALWFSLLVRTETLLSQDLAVQRSVYMPTPAESERRINEFARHLQQLNHVDIALPPNQDILPEYVSCNVYLVLDNSFELKITSEMYVPEALGRCVEGWPDGVPFLIQPIKMPRGGHDLILATACPPGRLTQDVWVGMANPRIS
jgi:hypothetical protein